MIKNCSYACIPTSDIVIYKKGSENETLVKSCMDSLTEFSGKTSHKQNKKETGNLLAKGFPSNFIKGEKRKRLAKIYNLFNSLKIL